MIKGYLHRTSCSSKSEDDLKLRFHVFPSTHTKAYMQLTFTTSFSWFSNFHEFQLTNASLVVYSMAQLSPNIEKNMHIGLLQPYNVQIVAWYFLNFVGTYCLCFQVGSPSWWGCLESNMCHSEEANNCGWYCT